MADARSLDWNDLRLVGAVAAARALPAAAAALGVNHSTAFRRLGALEAALGAPLFERHRTGYTLTATGEEIAALAGRVEDDIAAVTRRLAGLAASPAGEVRVATADSLLVHLLTPLFARFRERCPEVRIEVVVGNPALNLSKRDADVAVRVTDAPPETLVGRRAARIAWALYGRAADFPGPGAPTIDALAARSWVTLGDGFAARRVVRFVEETVPAARIAFRVDSVLGLAEAVEAGLGIGPLPCFIGDARPALVRLAPPDPAFTADLWLLTHPDLRQAPRIRVLLDFLAEELARLRPFIEGAGEEAARTVAVRP